MKALALLVGITLLGLVSAGGVIGPNLCEVLVDDECYWTEVHDRRDVNFTIANSICKSQGSIVATIPSEDAYNEIMENIRSKIPPERSWTVVWTGARINPTFNRVLSKKAYVKWYPGLPWKHRGSIKTFTKIYLEVKRLGDSKYQGMLYREPRAAMRGVVCRKN